MAHSSREVHSIMVGKGQLQGQAAGPSHTLLIVRKQTGK